MGNTKIRDFMSRSDEIKMIFELLQESNRKHDLAIKQISSLEATVNASNNILKNQVTLCSNRFNKIEEDVNGNGKEGLKEEVKDLKTFRNNILWLAGFISIVVASLWNFFIKFLFDKM